MTLVFCEIYAVFLQYELQYEAHWFKQYNNKKNKYW